LFSGRIGRQKLSPSLIVRGSRPLMRPALPPSAKLRIVNVDSKPLKLRRKALWEDMMCLCACRNFACEAR
jgi:hypothetical protein